MLQLPGTWPLTARAQELIGFGDAARGCDGDGDDDRRWATDSFAEDSDRPQPLAAEFQPLVAAGAAAAAQPHPLLLAVAALPLLPHPDDEFESIGGNET